MTNEATTPSGQPLGISHKPSKSGAMFTKFKAENKPAFIGYLPYGFPNPDVSLDAFKTMVEHGVDAVEIGLPYSDPVMDGPVIQAAASIALNNGETIKRVFEAVETVANAGGVPLIMSYWNLVYHYGVERFARDFENAGGAGLISSDLIPDEAGEWIEASDRHGLDRIFLVSPDSSTERLETVARNARGFVYAAARMGVTGERATIDASPELLVERTRKAGATNVCVGIGVATPGPGALRSNRNKVYRTAMAHVGRGRSGLTSRRCAALLVPVAPSYCCPGSASCLAARRHASHALRPLSMSCSRITGMPTILPLRLHSRRCVCVVTSRLHVAVSARRRVRPARIRTTLYRLVVSLGAGVIQRMKTLEVSCRAG